VSVIENITEWLLTATKTATLDIGSSTLRWAYGEIHQQKPSLMLFRSCRAPSITFLPPQTGSRVNSNELAELLQSIVQTKYGLEQYAAVILPDQAFHFGSISVPSAAGKTSLLPLLERDIQKSAAFPCSSYVIKHETGKIKAGRLTVQYCALPVQLLEDVQRACRQARIIPVSVQPSFTGLFRLLVQHQTISDHPSVFLHIGNESTTMGIYEKAGLRSVNLIDFGVQNLIDAASQELKCDIDSAVQTLFHEPLLLEDPGASEAQREILAFGAVESLLADFLQKIYGQLLLFTSENSEESGYSKIVISGGGALIKNLDRLITFNLGIPASTISNELKQLASIPGLPAQERLETLAPALGNISMQPVRRDRFDRVMAS